MMKNRTIFGTPAAAVAALFLLSGCAAAAHTGEANGLSVVVTELGETLAVVDDTTYGRFVEGDRFCWLDVEVENVSKHPIRLLSGGAVSDRSGPTSVVASRAHEPLDDDPLTWYDAVDELHGGFLPAGEVLAFGELVICDLDAGAGAALEINGDGGKLMVSVPIAIE